MLGVNIFPIGIETLRPVAMMHLQAFKSPLGLRYAESCIRWFLCAEQAIAFVATDIKGRVIGYVVGAPLKYIRRKGCDLRGVEAREMMLRPWLLLNGRFRNTVMARLRRALEHFQTDLAKPELPEPTAEPEISEPTMVLAHIAVSPSAREKQVGLHLMQAFEARAREFGMRALVLSVNERNKAARRLYEKCGWQIFPNPDDKKEAIQYVRLLFSLFALVAE